MADNTYLLALDGDVDFRPKAVRMLVDLMRKDEKVGAACGRIHPIGTGKGILSKIENNPADTWRNNNIISTPKRRRYVVLA